MEKIDFKKQDIPFTQVANAVLNDPKISLKAKGLYSYIYSKPNGWDFAYRRIAKDNTDGKAGVLSGLQELEDAGYLIRERQPNGRVVYNVVFPPIGATARKSDQYPKPEKATARKSHSGKIGLISNKDSYKVIKTIQSNKDIATDVAGIPEVIKEFEVVNQQASKWYGNTTQRKACTELIEANGLEQVLAVVKLLPKTNDKDYMPVITTPHQLAAKWSNLAAQLQRIKNRQDKQANNLMFL